MQQIQIQTQLQQIDAPNAHDFIQIAMRVLGAKSAVELAGRVGMPYKNVSRIYRSRYLNKYIELCQFALACRGESTSVEDMVRRFEALQTMFADTYDPATRRDFVEEGLAGHQCERLTVALNQRSGASSFITEAMCALWKATSIALRDECAAAQSDAHIAALLAVVRFRLDNAGVNYAHCKIEYFYKPDRRMWRVWLTKRIGGSVCPVELPFGDPQGGFFITLEQIRPIAVCLEAAI